MPFCWQGRDWVHTGCQPSAHWGSRREEKDKLLSPIRLAGLLRTGSTSGTRPPLPQTERERTKNQAEGSATGFEVLRIMQSRLRTLLLPGSDDEEAAEVV